MTKRTRRATLALIGTSGAALIAQAGAFSSIEVDRDIQIDTVSDERAYLELRDDELNEQLFDEMPPDGYEATKSFEIGNGLTTNQTLSVSIESEEFVIASADDGCDTLGHTDLQCSELGVGDSVEVTVGLPEGPSDSVEGTIMFEAETESGETVIEVERALKLRPEPGVEIKWRNINSPLDFGRDGIDFETVSVTIDGLSFSAKEKGGSGKKATVQISSDECEHICERSNKSFDATVTGETTDGIEFEADVEGVNCTSCNSRRRGP